MCIIGQTTLVSIILKLKLKFDPSIKRNCKQTFCYTLTKSLQHIKILYPSNQPFFCVKFCTNAPKNNEYGNTPLHIFCLLRGKKKPN
jgi:hypothetical protein